MPRPDKVYATRGGFVADFAGRARGSGPRPRAPEPARPRLSSRAPRGGPAWRSARTDAIDLRRAGVIFGNIVLPTEKSSSFSREILGRLIEEGLGLPASQHEPTDPLNAFPAGLPATLWRRRWGCAARRSRSTPPAPRRFTPSSWPIDELRSGRADVDALRRSLAARSALHPDGLLAASCPLGPGQARAVRRAGDGLIVGEGAGLFVLKRLDDAVRQGDTIHGLIRGIGLSNDVHGDLLAPSSEGQLRAMRAAYEQAGWSPHDVDLIECHATGTPVGDAVEVESLKRLWGDRESGWRPGQCVIGSVKSNVGHMLTAAGAAGLLKVLLALKHHVFPPPPTRRRPRPRSGWRTALSASFPTPEPGHPRGRPTQARRDQRFRLRRNQRPSC